MFIKLTDTNNIKYTVDVTCLKYYYQTAMGDKPVTFIKGLDNWFLETPEQISKILTESHIFIKEIV